MKIKILGSGGGERFPATFCGCDHCVEARRAGGKSIRSLSQTLINDDLLVDLPSDTDAHASRFGLNFGDVANILITHTHSDHFVPSVLFTRGSVYAHKLKYTEIGLYGSCDVNRVLETVDSAYGCNAGIKDSLHVNRILAYETKKVGDYEVTALPAKHALGKLVALNYIIKQGDKTLIYFHDTGYPNADVLDFIREKGFRADCVMLDATMGTADTHDTSGHMCFAQNKRLVQQLKEIGIAGESTVFVANHITHNNAETHDKIEQIFEGTGIIVSYDGLEIEI